MPLPGGAIARLGDLHFAQPGTINSVAVSPDDKIIATSGRDGIFLWNAQTGRIVREMAALDLRSTLSFAKSGRLLALATSDA